MPNLSAMLSERPVKLAAYTASGVGDSVPVPTITMLEAYLRLTAVSGSTPALDVWLESSPDDGVNWYVLPYDQRITTPVAGINLDSAADLNRRNINGTASLVAADAGKAFVGKYKVMPGDLVRPRWIISGATPSFTFEVWFKGK